MVTVDHGYSATIHKAQDVTVDRAHVPASEHMDRHAAYVAVRRHRDGVALHSSAEALGDRAGLGRTLGRGRLKDTGFASQLDTGPGYWAAYAERPGVGPAAAGQRHRGAAAGAEDGPGAEVCSGSAGLAAAKLVPGAELAENVAHGRAQSRDRFEARQRQQAEKAANEVGARALVGRWNQAVTEFMAVLPRLDTDPAYAPAREAMMELIPTASSRDRRPEPFCYRLGSAFVVDERVPCRAAGVHDLVVAVPNAPVEEVALAGRPRRFRSG